VSAFALDRLFDFADQRSYRIPAQFHSHATAAFLSHTDQQLGLRVKGFTSTVIPDFANPTSKVAAWGWWRFFSEDWDACQPPRIEGGDVEIVVFDEVGVRAQ
jgi:hypothetical protein